MSDIYLIQNGQQTGPFQRPELLQLVSAGQLDRQTQAYYEGLGTWQPLEKVLGLPSQGAVYLARTTTPPAPSVAVNSGEPWKVIVIGFKMPFWNMVSLLLQIAIASLPAAILYIIFVFFFGGLLSAVVGAVTLALLGHP